MAGLSCDSTPFPSARSSSGLAHHFERHSTHRFMFGFALFSLHLAANLPAAAITMTPFKRPNNDFTLQTDILSEVNV